MGSDLMGFSFMNFLIMTAFLYWLFGTITVFWFQRNFFDVTHCITRWELAIWTHIWIKLRDYPTPGFDFLGFSFMNFLIMTAFLYWLFGTITVFLCFRRTSFGAIRYALGSTERTTLPQVMIKGFKFRKEKLLLLWLRGVGEGLSSL